MINLTQVKMALYLHLLGIFGERVSYSYSPREEELILIQLLDSVDDVTMSSAGDIVRVQIDVFDPKEGSTIWTDETLRQIKDSLVGVNIFEGIIENAFWIYTQTEIEIPAFWEHSTKNWHAILRLRINYRETY